jgi:hypothetical protein
VCSSSPSDLVQQVHLDPHSITLSNKSFLGMLVIVTA